MVRGGRLMLFGLGSDQGYAQRVAQALGIGLSGHEERQFGDSESKCRPLDDVSRAEVFVLLSLHGEPGRSVNDKLCQLLFFIAALKDAGAERVTAVVPYLAYARKDHRSQFQDPITTRYVGALFEAVGTSSVITFDVHNIAAFENAFRCPTIDLSARPLFVQHFRDTAATLETVILAPDFGAAKRAEQLRQDLAAACGHEPGMALLEKYRSRGVVSGSAMAGDVEDKAVIVIDDMVSSGKTLGRAAQLCRDRGAAKVFAAVTHVLQIHIVQELADGVRFDGILIGDTIPHQFAADSRIQVVDSTSLLAQTIRTVHAAA